MELARLVYLQTEEFPQSETFGLRMQLRRSAVAIASHIADGHGRLTDAELRRSLSAARCMNWKLRRSWRVDSAF